MGVTAYPIAGKRKSFDLCVAFAKSCGGRVSTELRPGPAFFYGVDESNVAIWRAVRNDPSRDYFYADNSFFDATRQLYFRIAKNALQHSGRGKSDGKRFAEIGIQIKPWRESGDHIVVCPQSDHFMRIVVGSNADWLRKTLKALESLTFRPVLLRSWEGDKGKLAATLKNDLAGAHALLTWSSAAAITAVFEGVPIVTLGQCAAEPMAGGLKNIESLPRPAREEWAGVLADNQWRLDEIRDGTAWKHLNGEKA